MEAVRGGLSSRSLGRILAALSLLIIPLGLTAAFTSHNAYGWVTEQDAEGFDLCSSNFFDNNQNLVNFWNNTPWTTIGVYLGGSGAASVGCQAASASNIKYAFGLGYSVEALWYGYQMPYGSCQTEFNYPHQVALNNNQLATDQGEQAASEAASAAQAAGFNSGATIYYDMEEVINNSGCYAAAENFINGWDYELANVYHYQGGVYSPTCSGNISMYATIPNVPNAIAPADNLDDPTGVYNLRCLANGIWDINQRIHQLANSGTGGYQPQTFKYGASVYTVDEDCVDAPVEGSTAYGGSCQFIGGND
jgi:hypothetical protein